MGSKILRAVLAVLVVVAAATGTQAESSSLRCGTKLVSIGDRRFEVLGKCGEPDDRYFRTETRVKRDFYRNPNPDREPREEERYREPLIVEESVVIEEWVYNLGSTRFVRYLTFEDGILVLVEAGGYGY